MWCESELLAGLKARPERDRLTAPLFDSEHYTRDLEWVFAPLLETHRRGLPRSPSSSIRFRGGVFYLLRGKPLALERYLAGNEGRDQGMLRAYRDGGYTQTAIARAAGLSVSRVSRLIRAGEAKGKT